MDQILNEGHYMAQYAVPENQSSMLSMEYYINRIVTSILNQFIDGALFFDKGAVLYVRNNMMNLLKMYGIATVWYYTEEKKRIESWMKSENWKTVPCMSRLTAHFDLCFSVVSPATLGSKRSRSKAPGKISSEFAEVNASDFIFRILYEKYTLFQGLTADQKHKIGLFLIYAMRLESEEKKRIDVYLKNDTPQTYFDILTYLNYDEEIDEKFLGEIVKNLTEKDAAIMPTQKKRFSKIEISRIGDESDEAFYSAWYVAIAFVRYLENSKKSGLKWEQVKQHLPFIAAVGQSKELMKYLISKKKRMQEAMFQLYICKHYLPTSEQYEQEVPIPERDKEILKTLMNVPEVLVYGQCIDKQELFDVTIEKNIKKIIETLKNQSKETLMSENIKKMLSLLESPKESIETARNIVNYEVNVFFKNLIQVLKSQLYNEFLMPSHVLHGTFPLIGSLYFTQEMLRLAQRELSNDVQNVSKMAIYGLFPLVLSVIYETQESILGEYSSVLSSPKA